MIGFYLAPSRGHLQGNQRPFANRYALKDLLAHGESANPQEVGEIRVAWPKTLRKSENRGGDF